jgi:hypothetical protein
MITPKLMQFSFYALLITIGALGVFTFQYIYPQEKVNYDRIRRMVSEEVAKVPKPEPAQGLDIDKIKGKIGHLTINQNYTIAIEGDSIQNILRESVDTSIKKNLSDYKLKRK